MIIPPGVANEIARLMRDPDSMRHEVEHMRSRRRDHYDPNQPRVPAGNSDGGQWTDADSASGNAASDASTEGEQPQLVRFLPGGSLAGARVGSALLSLLTALLGRNLPEPRALALFDEFSARNTRNRRAIFKFNAKEFLQNPSRELDHRNIRVLTREEVGNVCKKLDDVQSRTDAAASAARSGDLSEQQFGTAVHTRVAQEINGPGGIRNPKDPNYRAEVSYWKMIEDEVYSRKDSIRIDVLENAGRRLVCVYDIKTGQSRRSGLTLKRMLEIAAHVLGAYPDTERVIITEVRPAR